MSATPEKAEAWMRARFGRRDTPGFVVHDGYLYAEAVAGMERALASCPLVEAVVRGRSLSSEEVTDLTAPRQTIHEIGTRVRVVEGQFRGLRGTVASLCGSPPTGATVRADIESRRLLVDYPFTFLEEVS